MPRRIGDISEAERQAQRLLRRFGVRSPDHIRVELFAERLGVEIHKTPLDGATAQLVRRGQRATIFVHDPLPSRGIRRFSVAHELGHLVMNHPSPGLDALCAGTPTQPVQGVKRKHESEANAFAAELLMPGELLRERCKAVAFTLRSAEQIAEEFEVSVAASAIRIVELTDQPCAVVMSEKGAVTWSVRSSTFPQSIRRRVPVREGSLAWHTFATGAVPEGPHAVRADAWLDPREHRTGAEEGAPRLMEQAIGAQTPGAVLSLLTVPM